MLNFMLSIFKDANLLFSLSRAELNSSETWIENGLSGEMLGTVQCAFSVLLLLHEPYRDRAMCIGCPELNQPRVWIYSKISGIYSKISGNNFSFCDPLLTYLPSYYTNGQKIRSHPPPLKFAKLWWGLIFWTHFMTPKWPVLSAWWFDRKLIWGFGTERCLVLVPLFWVMQLFLPPSSDCSGVSGLFTVIYHLFDCWAKTNRKLNIEQTY